ncbi:MAPEG family protein [Idiomarina xiamenensis]|uniref:MAPEG superfamily glutathione S-transferase n=1 Tax=Idiomarina xiamenensis 10-D-4 TaxID=740709 RepID=K2KYP7_9GAMM|nr:MAPEG family protein [Idiomarina xiamenensis]EKE82840.1 MAPEG superfamily glutathione S-transferase [Idiomarina xiamenensis 10-D-4]
MTESLTIVGLYASLLALLLFVLSARIIRLRWRYRVGIGSGKELSLQTAIRAHGNFIEYVPLLLLILTLMAFLGASPLLLHSLGAGLFIARVFHAIGLSSNAGVSLARSVGVLLNFTVLLLSSGYLLGVAIQRLMA